MQYHFSDDGHRLIRGGVVSGGFYNESEVDTIYLVFSQPNYWNLLISNYQSKTDLPATMIFKGTVYDSVGVRFRGQTSYMNTQNSQKKSFNITMDYVIEGQHVGGYKTLNLNNGFDDPSFLREVLYNNLCRNHIANAQANFVILFINGQNWGLYPNVQQLNKQHVAEWFTDDEATRWRCEKVNQGGPGGMFGAGYSSLNYLGDDTADYQPYYKLKKAFKENPWDDLVHVCDVLNNSSAGTLVDTLNTCMDVDGALWYIAHENIYCDDDGYINKGGMDYYAYFDVATGRLVPIEYDGNSTFHQQFITSWTPFKRASEPAYALIYRLLNHSELRQRYLAHYRTVLNEYFNQQQISAKIDAYAELIDDHVQNDPKKLYSYTQFLSTINTLKNFFPSRSSYLWNNPELNVTGLSITDVSYQVDGIPYNPPAYNQTATVNATVTGNPGVYQVVLYYGTGFSGKFNKTGMFDDGLHGDGAAGDHVFGGFIPPHGSGKYVRFYIEALSANSAHTASYEPTGAEHDVYIYQVLYGTSEEDVVINELMASNATTAMDEFGEFDDWIEFYNAGTTEFSLAGYYLTDNADNLMKWTFPDSAIIEPDGYLIVWADEDGSQGNLHCNFKLSASGEIIILANPNLEIVDSLSFGEQVTDMGLARVPNGTGNFVIQSPTFASSNDLSTGVQEEPGSCGFTFFPNPASDKVTFLNPSGKPVYAIVYNTFGRPVTEFQIDREYRLDVSGWQTGFYFLKTPVNVSKLIISR